ncbi:MAG: 2'-5' RNA ligase family protein [Ferrimicrobium sp.]
MAVTFADPIETELNVVRRLLGSRSTDWIPPHITLVPPVDCTPMEAWLWVGRIGTLSTQVAPVDLELSGFGFFANRRITGHLPVEAGGEALGQWHDRLVGLPDERPYLPHVTVVEDLDLATSSVLRERLAQYTLAVQAKEVSLLVADARGKRRGWRPFLRALVGFGGLRRRAHRSVLAVLSHSSPLSHQGSAPSISCWLLDESGGLLGWGEAIGAPSGVWILNDPVLLDGDLVGCGFEELVVEELMEYLRPRTLVGQSSTKILDTFGARSMSAEAAWLLGLDQLGLDHSGLAMADSKGLGGSYAIRWKFLSFSTR